MRHWLRERTHVRQNKLRLRLPRALQKLLEAAIAGPVVGGRRGAPIKSLPPRCFCLLRKRLEIVSNPPFTPRIVAAKVCFGCFPCRWVHSVETDQRLEDLE